MKKIIVLLMALVLLTVAAAQQLPPPQCPGCGGDDCGAPCGYEWGSDPVGPPLQCPGDCHCWYFTDASGAYVPVEDPSTGKLWEGWCYEEPEPDIPEFTILGGMVVLGLAGLFIYRRRK